MSLSAPRAAKRLRLTSARTPWTCTECVRRSFVTSQRGGLLQQQTPQPRSQRPSPAPSSSRNNGTTHFGFETVDETAKESRVGAVFSSVASSYDVMNDFMSLGIHRLWKDHFVRSLDPGMKRTPTTSSEFNAASPARPQRILDIAGGSGDIALRMLDHATRIHGDTASHVTISDINPDMLAEGRKRLSQTPYHAQGRVDYLEANAEDLSAIESNSIDLYTVAFGIRNFTHKDRALREAFRVLRPGGVFACLEFAPQLSNSLLNAVYKRWSFSAIPLIGQIVASDRDSYQYLVESIERFPSQPEWARMISEAGFLIPGDVGGEVGSGGRSPGQTPMQHGWEDLSLGIAAIHKGVKPV